MMEYELLDHTADLGAVFYGENPQGVFVSAGLALFDLMVDHLPADGPRSVRIDIEGTDPADVMVRYLGELLYLFQVQRLVAGVISVLSWENNRLAVNVRGEDHDPARHGQKHEIKAATYHQAVFEPWDGRWRARVVFDL
jgi:SHS2 domain-containing protein